MQTIDGEKVFEFGGFRLDPRNYKLYRSDTDELVKLPLKASELLLELVRGRGSVLTKEALMNAVWADSFVEEANLSQTIFLLRKALGEDTKIPRYILTIPGRGYQFIAEVREIHAEDEILNESILSGAGTTTESRRQTPKTESQKPRLIWLAIPLILLAALGAYWFYPVVKTAAVGDIKSIAVLPLEDLSEGETEKYLGVSLADVLAKRFGALKQLIVRPSGSSLKYAENRADVGKIGRELQVDAVLDGRIQRDGARIRVSLQLIRTADNTTIWTENFDDQFTNFFSVQDSISQKVVSSLAVQMDEAERTRFDRRGTENAAAYQDYLRGRYFWNKRTAADLLKAIGHFEQATEKDTNFAHAHAGLADCYILLAEYGATSPHEAFRRAKPAIKRALEIDDQLAEAHAALAYTQAFYDWNWAGAEQSFKRALELNPNYATTHQWYAEFLDAMGRFGEARLHFERAIEIDPVSPIVLNGLAGHYEYQSDSDKSIAQARKVLEIEPNFAYGHFYLGLAYERKGMEAEAAATLAKTMTLFGEPPECAAEVAAAFEKNGMKGWWKKRLEQIETRPHLKNFQAYSKALVQMRFDDKEGALKSLNEAYERRDRWFILLKHQPHLEPLRGDPRFQDLLTRIGL